MTNFHEKFVPTSALKNWTFEGGQRCLIVKLENIKKRGPNCGVVGGVNTFVKIKCLRRRTALMQSALCSPDLGECFKYPEHVFN